jgi:tetratricopeptide (TPR) repeat protein
MKLNTTQWVTIASCSLLVIGIYLFADTKKPSREKADRPLASRDAKKPAEEPTYDWAGYLAKVKANISSADTMNKINNWEKEESEANLRNLVNTYHALGESVVEAHYTLALANLKNDPKLATRAGDLYSATAGISSDESLHKYLIDKEVNSYKMALEADTGSKDNKLKLATAYMDQGTTPMQGVTILLDLVRRDSTNAEAQMMLGKFGIVSGQYEKAIIRLEKVVSLRPKNYDALFLLAEAYRGNGNKQKAVELLQRCKQLIDKPQLKKEIEKYISNIQSS